MWLTCSSIGRKLVMAVTGACLVLFVTFHVLMNAVAIAWPAAYNSVCEFLGANWYALIACVGLALLFIIHVLYAIWLTLQNRKARGNDAYKVTSRPKTVEWSSQNMLVLGIVVVAFMVVHFYQFWAKMQWQDICGTWFTENGVEYPAGAGTLFIQLAFANVWTLVVYLIGFAALWFHMTHGFWSMFQSAGWNNNTWIPRLRCIGNGWATVVCALFAVEAVVFTVNAQNNYYFTDAELKAQYREMIVDKLNEEIAPMQLELQLMQESLQSGRASESAMTRFYELREKVEATASHYVDVLHAVETLGAETSAVEEVVVEDAAEVVDTAVVEVAADTIVEQN